jgi:hypothetical protein
MPGTITISVQIGRLFIVGYPFLSLVKATDTHFIVLFDPTCALTHDLHRCSKNERRSGEKSMSSTFTSISICFDHLCISLVNADY